MTHTCRFLTLIGFCLLLAVQLPAQVTPPGGRTVTTRPTAPGTRTLPGRLGAGGAAGAETPKADGSVGAGVLKDGLKFDNAASDLVLQAYADLSGKTLIYSPQAPKATITLMTNPKQKFDVNGYLEAIRYALNQNGIELLPLGDLFVLVLPLNAIGPGGIEPLFLVATNGVLPELPAPDVGRAVNVSYPLKNLTTEEGKKIVEPLKRPEGQIITIERNNSLQLIDTYENVKIMFKMLNFVDQPIPVLEEVYPRKIAYAKAADIKKKLEEVVAESQKQQQGKDVAQPRASGSPGMETVRSRPVIAPGVIRPPAATTPDPTPSNPTIDATISDADRGMIRGKVQIIDDERTNMLIIITNPSNMEFFDKLITVFDVETSPDVVVDVIRMEHAKAEDVAALLNDLLGSTKDDSARTGSGANANAGTRNRETLSEAATRSRDVPTSTPALTEGAKSKVGELNKDNITILHDERSNAVVIMATRGDLASLRDIIKSIDIQLSQVLIEIVVLDVNLENTLEAGVDWLNRKLSINDGDIRGGGVFGAGSVQPIKVAADFFLNTATNILNRTSGLMYYFSSDALNLDMVIKAAANDNNAQVLASPVVLTLDNKEATIKSTEMRYLFNGYKYTGYTSNNNNADLQADIQQKDIGLTVTVTPRINQAGMIVLTIAEEFQNVVEPGQLIDGVYWPTVNTRIINADVSVNNGETIILGGLIRREKGKANSGVPYLRNIPFIGWLFGTIKETEKRSELLVFLTPYVLDTASQRSLETQRRKDILGSNAGLWSSQISGSKLAERDTKEELRLLGQKWGQEKEIREGIEKLEKAQAEHDREMKKIETRRQSRPAPVEPAKSDPDNASSLRVTVPTNDTTTVLDRSEAAGFINTEPVP